MAHIEVLDQTIRDGPQSLYVDRMGTMPEEVSLRLARELPRIGFRAIDFIAYMKIVRLTRAGVDAFGHIHQVKAAFGDVPMRCGTMVNQLTFAIESDEIMDWSLDLASRWGANEFWVFDVLHPIDAMRRRARAMTEVGLSPYPAIMFTDSPVHTDEWFAERARQYAQIPGVGGIYVEDTAGALRPERARTLMAAIRAAIGDLPLEAHFHDVNGLGVPCYLEAVGAGATTVHTAIGPLGGGGSLPCLEHFLDNADRTGACEVTLDRAAIDEVSRTAWLLTKAYGLPRGGPTPFDATVYNHQLPGGMRASLLRQLEEVGLGDQLDAILDEMSRLRREFGYPPMATPISQFVGVQATMNVTTDERFSQIPDEVFHYLLGHYGEIPGELDGEMLDRVADHPRYQELAKWSPPTTTVKQLRDTLGNPDTDEELILRYLCTSADLAKLAGVRAERALDKPVRANVQAVRALLGSPAVSLIDVGSDQLRIRVSRQPHSHV